MNEGRPIDASTSEWIDARTAWILHEFGRERITTCDIILPTEDFFPNRFDQSEQAAQEMLELVCGFLQLNPEEIELVLYHEKEWRGDDTTTAGRYEQKSDGFRVWVEESELREPLDLAATLAHELCHVHLLGYGRLTAEEDDHEPLTDLLTVFLGMGILTANSALNEIYRKALLGWRSRKAGYLTMPAFGYALALFSMLRGESEPTWRIYLRPDVREVFDKSLHYFVMNGMPALNRVVSTDARPVLQSELREEGEAAGETAECPYCGAKLYYRGTCEKCRASIQEHQRDLELEREEDEAETQWSTHILNWGCLLVILLFCLAVLLEFLGIIS